jgi:hypothetical protein
MPNAGRDCISAGLFSELHCSSDNSVASQGYVRVFHIVECIARISSSLDNLAILLWSAHVSDFLMSEVVCCS